MTALLLEGYDDGLWTDRVTTFVGGTVSGPRTGPTNRRYNGPGWFDEWVFPAADEHATFIVGMGFYANTAVNGYFLHFKADDGATTHITLHRLNTGRLQVWRGTSTALLGETDTGIISQDKWYHIEMFVTLHDTTGAVKLRVNGQTPAGWSDLTSQDTKNGGTAAVLDTIRINPQNADLYGDDVVIMNGAGSKNNDLIGDTRVWMLLPDGNGNYSQLNGSDGNQVNNYQQVDENPPVTSDYNGHATNANKDTYTFEDLIPTTGTVHALQASIQALKSDSGTKSMRIVHRRASTDSVGADHALNVAADTFDEIWEDDPSDAAAWDITRVNASEFGAEVRA